MLSMVYPRWMKALQWRVAQVYYTHGLFCASHPLSIICGVICLALLACYPLTNLPLPGNAPVEVNTPIKEYVNPTPSTGDKWKDDLVKQRWYLSQPVAYVQQVVVKGTVSPWETVALLPTDAIRGPLSNVFPILNIVTNFKITDNESTVSLDDLCLRVGEVSNKRVKGFLPEYNCLIISPANFWKGDFMRFKGDADELKTINKMYSQPLETPPTLQDLLFGVPWKKTGMSRYLIRNRRRTITYAITIIYKTFNPRFTEALREKLEALYPQPGENVNSTDVEYLVHIQYKDINYFVEYTPLLLTYFVLLLYLYFSVKKIEMVKSKWGLAISAVATVIASLFMSVSICTLFGLTPTLNGGEIFPYLVVIIGLENVIVLTKSVVSTPVHLDVKYRVAQGLSKEGWSITKNLVTELLIILVGFFTFVPAIQEFCLFAVVGLLSDFFLQIVFFATVLSVDIRRMELSDLQKQSIQQEMSAEELSFPVIEPLLRCPVMTRIPCQTNDPTSTPNPERIPRSKSASGLDTIDVSGTPPSPLYEVEDSIFPSPTILPRRLRVLYFWARTRMFQRAIMVCTVIWIGLIMYKTGLVERLAAASESLSSQTDSTLFNSIDSALKGAGHGGQAEGNGGQGGQWAGPVGSAGNHWSSETENMHGNLKEEEQTTEHGELELWRHLSFKHWRTLFRYYNISFTGRHISILPSIHLSVTVSPDEAIQVRHPSKAKLYNNVKATGKPSMSPKPPSSPGRLQHPAVPPLGLDVPLHTLKLFHPQGMKELIITIVLAILSIFLLLYFLVILYKCCCSRNYDKWRSSWVKKSRRMKDKYFRQIQNSVPLILKGHSLEIECLSTDGPLVVSSCLGGQLRVWDSNSGECVTVIQRRGVTPPMKRKPCVGRNVEDSDADLYAEFHGEIIQNQQKLRNIRTDFLKRRSSENYASFDGVDTPVSYPRSEGAGDGHGLPWRPFQTMPEQQISERGEEESRLRSWSAGSNISQASDGDQWFAPAVWCIVCQDNLIVCGCGNGRIEFWDSLTGVLRYVYDDCKEGVTSICVNGNRVMAARLSGEIDFLELETFQNPAKSHVQQVTVLHNRVHVRDSSGQLNTFSSSHWEELIHYNLIERTHAHQQPINSLQSVGGRVVSASIDHTLKVFRVEDCVCLYTLYGHLGSVTALYLDKVPPFAASSGSVDGTVRLWDLVTGACVHKMKGHTGTVTTLTCTNQFVISSGQDDMLCVWERGHGQLVHRIQDDGCGFTSLAMIFSNILVTGGESCICLWDIVKGEMVKKVTLGSPCRPASVNSVQVIGKTTVICDYSNEIHIIHFPTVLEKTQ